MSAIAKQRGVFVTGTDTEIGKTWCSVGLLEALAARGLRVAGLKPVAAGAVHTTAGWRNDDALALQAAASVVLPYERVNPLCLPEACSPHLAARAAGVRIDLAALVTHCERVAFDTDWLLVEGAGGWLAPLTEEQSIADFAQRLGMPVLLVVGMRLGCLNHAQLTWEAMDRHGCRRAGWIANVVDPLTPRLDEQVETLTRRLGGAPLAVLPRGLETAARRAALALAAWRLYTVSL
jgi:dethiobiotin synthetase